MAGHPGVVKLDGISAKLATPQPDVPGEAEAKSAFFRNSGKADLGRRVIVATEDGRRYALRIMSRQPLTDQALPDRQTSANMVPASSAHMINLVSGRWLYRITVEALDSPPALAVQQNL
jgi:hypothetical protein